MPRSKPDKVVVHRIELGSLERSEIKELIKHQSLLKDITTANEVGKTVVIAGGVVGAGYVSYKLINVLIQYLAELGALIPEIPPEVAEAATEAGISPMNLAFPITWQGPLTWRARRDAWAKRWGESLGLR